MSKPLFYKLNSIDYIIHDNSRKEFPVGLKVVLGVGIVAGVVTISPFIVAVAVIAAVPALVIYMKDPDKNTPPDPMKRIKTDKSGKEHLSTTVNVMRDLIKASKEHELSRDEVINAKKIINTELKKVRNEDDLRLSADELTALKQDMFEYAKAENNVSDDGEVELNLKNYSLVNAKEKAYSADEISIPVHKIKLG